MCAVIAVCLVQRSRGNFLQNTALLKHLIWALTWSNNSAAFEPQVQHVHSGTSIFPGGRRGSFLLLVFVVELGQDARAEDRSSECSLCCLWSFRFPATLVPARIKCFAMLEMTPEAVWSTDGSVKNLWNTFTAVYMQGPVWLTACAWLWIQVWTECYISMRRDGHVSFEFSWGWTGLGTLMQVVFPEEVTPVMCHSAWGKRK